MKKIVPRIDDRCRNRRWTDRKERWPWSCERWEGQIEERVGASAARRSQSAASPHALSPQSAAHHHPSLFLQQRQQLEKNMRQDN